MHVSEVDADPTLETTGVPLVEGTLRGVYHRLVGGRRREVIWHLRHHLGMTLRQALMHEARWGVGSPAGRARRAMESLPPNGHVWCFVLGVNNSGTTLLENILRQHPDVRGLPAEGQFLTAALARPRDFDAGRRWMSRKAEFRWTEDSDGSPAHRCVYDWMPYLSRQHGHVLLEKSPPNTIRSRWLQANFTPARFVAMFRSPYAVAEGVRRRTGASLEDAARHWTEANRLFLEDVASLEHVVRIRYEDFCETPARYLSELTKFLGLTSPFAADATRELRVHNIDDAVGGVRNFNQKSLDRLSRDELRTIEDIAGPVMAALGYERLS
jgi:hypothetical protein